MTAKQENLLYKRAIGENSVFLSMDEEDSLPSACAPVVQSVNVVQGSGDSLSCVVSTLRRERKPVGLKNYLHSSCYLNSVLQCLTFTPPLAEYCRQQGHSRNCVGSPNWQCTLCILEQQIKRSLEALVKVDSPRVLRMHVTTISGLFQPGRQEDAHELLSFLIQNCAEFFEDSSNHVLKKLFGGVLQNHIECKECNAASMKHEDMLDLSLNICEVDTVDQALANFFRPEVLDGENKYHCKGCDSLSVARKRISIHQMPKVLTIQLQRFDPLSGNKLQHFVQFEDQLCVTNYMSQKFTENPIPHYKLYGIIEHLGKSSQSGHYVSAVKETNGTWYFCNDEKVSKSVVSAILKARAYLLFYIRSDVTENELCL